MKRQGKDVLVRFELEQLLGFGTRIPNCDSIFLAADNQAAAILAAWLDGQRLLRDRLLAILSEAGIEPIPTVGQTFDPYRHVAVGTVEDESLPDGHIVAEERRGYAAGDHVLRYAEVVVVKNRVTRTEERVTSDEQYPISNTQLLEVRMQNKP